MWDPEKISLNFILATGRTGSTLLSSMLNMHSQILSVSEEPFAYTLFAKYKNVLNWTDDIIESFCFDFFLFAEGKLVAQFGTKAELITILKAHRNYLTGTNAIKLSYFAFFPGKDKGKVNTIVDKQLKFHHVLKDIAEYYPESKFIILYRDARDNVLIKYKRASKQKKRASLFYFAKTWDYAYKTINRKIENLDSARYIKIKYEDLTREPSETLQKITTFLNLPYNPAMLEYDVNFKTEIQNSDLLGEDVHKHLALFHEGLSQKVNTDKTGIWKRELQPLQYNGIWNICGQTALASGYLKENCETRSGITFFNFYDYGRFLFSKIIVPNLYYALPRRIIYFIKKIKYGKNFKNGKHQYKDFYKTTLPID